MNNDVVIKVENIGKRYEIGEKSSFLTLRDKLIELPRRIFQGPAKTKSFWALKNVSFEIKRGEVVGIIGRNGAGKSTLLKILARITEPTTGKITMKGRVASMLEVGTGFNPELTGRENIYLNGAIIGMKKKEIESKFEEIVAFSGVEKFLDTPVKHYSSGMYVRLAFAVAAHLDADILLIDEVLAVGDVEFQKKCLGKMSDLANSGRTVVYVSHNLESVRSLCTKAMLLTSSKLHIYSSPNAAISKYQDRPRDDNTKIEYPNDNSKDVVIRSIELINKNGKNTKDFSYKDTVFIRLLIEVNQPTKSAEISVGISNSQGVNICFSSISDSNKGSYVYLSKGKHIMTLVTRPFFFVPDQYFLMATTHYRGVKRIDYQENALSFNILESDSQLSQYGDAGKNLAVVLSNFEWTLGEKN